MRATDQLGQAPTDEDTNAAGADNASQPPASRSDGHADLACQRSQVTRSSTLFTVGPVEMDASTLEAGAVQLPYFRTAEFSRTVLQTERMLKSLLGTAESSLAAFLAASGTGAMEAAVINTFTPSDYILVVEGGDFGRRFAQICAAHGITYETLQLEFGEAFTPAHLEKFKDRGFTGMLVNCHETSTGQLYDMTVIRDFCREQGLCLVVDAIGSFLADEFAMDYLGVDVTIISSQKALGLPPGLSMVVANRETYARRIQCNTPQSVYLDMKCYMKDIQRGQTPFTPAEGILIQLHEKLGRLTSESSETAVRRSRRLASDFRRRAASIGLTIPTYPLSNALTPLICPSAYEVFTRLKDVYGFWVTPSGGELRDVLIRVGHLGNLTEDDNAKLIEALGKVVAR